MSIDRLAVFAALALLINMAPMLQAGDGICWIQFTDDTSPRLIAEREFGANDLEEKDLAWGDVDHDGDIDLVVARKEPFSAGGPAPNVLFLNEGIQEGHPTNGVLVDRTDQYVTDSDIKGDLGFLTPTNDRDIALVDVNGDGWLDIITAPTNSDGLPKHLGHPRVYINLGESNGTWQGYRFEAARIPQLFTVGGLAVNPRFMSVTPLDADQDGDQDLYFTDMDSSEFSGPSEPIAFDLNDRLLINDGSGHFDDESFRRMTSEMLDSSGGFSSAVADFNRDGAIDILKQSAMFSPQYVSIAYNNPESPGYFNRHWTTSTGLAPYQVTAGDLNNDGWADIVVGDNHQDRYMINLGIETVGPSSGLAEFFGLLFPSVFKSGHVGNILISDINQDGLKDVITCDVDTDIFGCTDRMIIHRNKGFTFGSADPVLETFVSFEELEGPGMSEEAWHGAPGLPVTLEGTHDVAVFDLDQDGNNDLVIGRCFGYSIYMGAPYIEGDPSACMCGHKGDCDHDCNIDLVDFANFQTCYTGPGSAWAEGCWCSDFDNDGDVDLADFAQFQIAFTGP